MVLAETAKAAESVIEAFRGLDANILAQEFIKEAGGADIRCLVVGGKVIASMKRQGKEGDFRSNLHRGGNATVVKITPEERSTAVRAANIMGLSMAGVDLLRSNHGPVVLEVNSSPGLEGIEKATNKDVAGEIIKFIEKSVGRVTKSNSRQGLVVTSSAWLRNDKLCSRRHSLKCRAQPQRVKGKWRLRLVHTGARNVASKRQNPASALETKTGLEVFNAFSP